MAWLDDRIWAHPKLARVGWKARAIYMYSLAYSSGFGLYGRLEPGHQRMIGSSPSVRENLIEVGLWNEAESGAVEINDWNEHNAKRDDAIVEKRAKDRERKRLARAKAREMSTRTSDGLSNGHTPDKADISADETADISRTPPAPARRERMGAPPMTSDRVTKDLATSSSSPKADDDAQIEDRLQAAGWSEGRIAIVSGRGHLDLAARWLTTAEQDPTIENPGAYSYAMTEGGTEPPPARERQATLAKGATGTRSSSPPLPDRPPEPDPEPAPPPADFLKLARHTGEPPAPPRPKAKH